MPLSANDVLNKRFEVVRSREGYAQEEVDAYLEEVVDAMRLLEGQVSAASGEPGAASQEQIAAAIAPRDHRIEELERENAYLRDELEAAKGRLERD
ncbi:DivIVA domain-containing protein [Actinomyces bowdenii]|uniref:DivIVA domain-containing protein n=2 Tax=Actinomyces TaxID=1654 RepID=A0A853EJJ2_9ACTO|nr:DivIVA domain-containing protein [Actinomyces capricornis]MBF0697344.1 DivIVA domain-containing protein [Actinomyces bowdenii]NYS69517.1 DivIVA domain-containing protein [Actinomyces bowdenii]BDA64738.1 hypothetical protein MANAM107_15720 [Actinomyces capricornis]